MKLTWARFSQSADIALLGAWCLFTGPEERLKQEALARLRAEAESGDREPPAWERLEGATVSAREVLNRSQSASLFGGARVVVVGEVNRMLAKEQEELAKGVGPLPEGVAVVLIAQGGDRRRGVRAALARAVERAGVVVDFPALRPPEAAAWIVRRAKELGKRLEPAAARKLADQKIGPHLRQLEQELEKLALYVGEGATISAAHVEEVTPRLIEESVNRLLDAVGRRSPGPAVVILRELLEEQREAPERILGALSSSLRLLWQTKLLLERGWRPGAEVDEEAAAMLLQDPRRSALGQFARRSWAAGRSAQQAQALSWGQLERALLSLHACDLALKGIAGKIGDPATALELLVVQLCSDLEMPVWGRM